MRYKITVSGVLETGVGEDGIRRDFPLFVSGLESVHSDVVPGSVTLDGVEALPEPDPEPEVQARQEDTVEIDPTAVGANTAAILASLNAIAARLDKAGL
jgi:hypothetical protein